MIGIDPAGRYKLPIRYRLARLTLKPVFQALFHILGPVKITGRENIPPKGAYIVAYNHVSIFDPPVMLAFWPVFLEVIGAVEVWSRRGQSSLARLYGAIQVHRGEFDRHAIELMIAALRSGRPLLIAPEGSRSHTPGMNPAMPGIAYIIDEAAVPVVPVGVIGTTDDYFKKASHGRRPAIEIHVGHPLQLSPIEGKGEARRVARQYHADLVMHQIAALLPENYRGVYADGKT